MEQVAIGERSFLVNDLPTGYVLDFEPFLYTLPEFLNLRTDQEPVAYFICSPHHKSAIAAIKFHVDHGLAESGGLAPFGSFDLSENINEQELEWTILNIKEALIRQSVNRIRIRHYPAFYSPKFHNNLGQLLAATGFEIVESQLNHHLYTHQSFEQQLHPMEKRKLQAILSMSPSFSRETLDQLPEIYNFIHSCRKERGQVISLKFDELRRMVDQFPARYSIFATRIGRELAAASICVRVTDQVMYNFYPAFRQKFQRFSPLVYLMKGIHDICRDDGISILDLGTSELNGRLNTSLSRFKDRLGGNTSLKYSFEWAREGSE